MLFNLLTNADKVRPSNPGETALYAVLGFAVVFFGIAFLIFVVWLVGKAMQNNKNKKGVTNKKPFIKTAPDIEESLAITDAMAASTKAKEDALDEETMAVITAAIMAYYQTNKPKCEFTVKRIKRI